MENYILTLLIFIPVIGAIIMLPISRFFGNSYSKVVALCATGLQLLLAGWLYINFDSSLSIEKSPFTIELPWIEHFNIYYYIGVDGLSMPMVLLTALLSFICIISSWNINKRPLGYFSLFLLLDAGMMGVFLSMDFFLFYIFWEVMLLPMYFLIGMWGGPQRHYAAIKFFLYTLFGSVFMLLAMLALYYYTTPNTFSLTTLIIEAPKIDATLWGLDVRYLIWIGLFIGFAIKVPVFPFHTWLPLAHVEAPTAISVILAGVLLKMGTYGLLRISYPLLPFEAINFAYTLAVLGVINIIWGAMNAIAQIDMKKMVAYSSVSHMGYVLLGMASIVSTSTAGAQAGLNGAVMQMFNHGTITAMLFLLVGVLYDQAHHRYIVYPDNYKDQEVAGKLAFGGLAAKLPVFNALIIIAFFAGLGLPALSGFISEALCFIGGFSAFRTITIIGTLGILLNAIYFLRAYQRVFTGSFNEKYSNLRDISNRELITVIPIAVLVFLFGVYPAPLINMIKHSVDNLINIFQAAL
ncbi:NADH-quinone oxidoreductase subunit M [Candidatus Marinimicrobia bacterium]|nr:NADH-quinone oxidoreductase subunit M [Candidatus Neomarinimicrobiota bacterium]